MAFRCETHNNGTPLRWSMSVIENFKAMGQVKEQLDCISESVRSLNEAVLAVKADLASLRQHTMDAVAARNEARLVQQEFSKAAKTELDAVQELRIKLGREINAFDSVKRELATVLAKRVEAELKSSIGEATNELKSKVLDVKQARDSLDNLSQLAARANESLVRLHLAAKDIQSKDFDLSKALETIKTAEKEKFELMQRVERAESYAAKEVRRMSGRRTM